MDWVLNKIVIFLQFQKERTVKGELTAATLSNFVNHQLRGWADTVQQRLLTPANCDCLKAWTRPP